MIVRALILLLAGWTFAAIPSTAWAGEPTGPVVIVGNGPEQGTIELLARAFEKKHPRAYVDIQWHENLKPLELLRSGKADLAVGGKAEADLSAVSVAWDGIALMVNLSNTTKEVTTQQVAELFSGKVKSWSQLGGPDNRVLLIDRPPNRNIRDAFEQYLGIQGRIPEDTKVIRSDEKAINAVVGTLPPSSAVTYLSLKPALIAVSTGVAVRLLPVDGAEPEKPTVKNGRYKLRRPVLFLTRKGPSPTTKAFLDFVLSGAGQMILDQEGYIPLDHK